MFQSILYRFYFLRRRMFPRLFQLLYRIRSIIHRQSQIPFYLCDICGMYFEAVFRFYVLLYHLIGHSRFRLVRFGSFSDMIKQYFSLALAKLHINVDITICFFVGQKNNRLHMCRNYYVNTIFQPRRLYKNTILCYYFFAFFFAILCRFLMLSKYSSSTGDKFYT